MKVYTGRRAKNIAVFQAERGREKAVVEAIWKRDESKCVLCKRSVTLPNKFSPSPGYIKWRDPRVITVDNGFLVCRQHFTANQV